jgi:hypothetical protein
MESPGWWMDCPCATAPTPPFLLPSRPKSRSIGQVTCIRVVPLDSVFIPPFSEVTRDVTAAQVLKLFSPYVKIRNTPPCGDLGHKDGKAYPGRIRATAPPAASSAR